MYSYQTLKNDRRRRRKAVAVTALVTIGLLAAAAYTAGAFDQWLAPEAPATEVIADAPTA
ncbi:MAG: hypothetical protein AAGF89_09915 [Bacteroidota bacterium]